MKKNILFPFIFIGTFLLFSAANAAWFCSNLMRESVVSKDTKAKIGLDVNNTEDILKVGAKIKTPGGMRLQVTRVILDGHKGVVYQALDKNGRAYAVKVPRFDLEDYNYDSMESLQREIDKIPGYVTLGVPYAMIYEHGRDYVVKEWVEGTRGDLWVRQWVENGRNSKDPLYLQLLQLFDSIASQKAHIGNMKSINLIHNGLDWVIVDGGNSKFDFGKPKDIYARYLETFNNRWVGHIQRYNP